MLATRVGALELCSPLLTASGTFGHDGEATAFLEAGDLGALVLKTVTPRPRHGNRPPRLVETPAGLLNSIGLENRGVEVFLEQNLAALEAKFAPTTIGYFVGNRHYAAHIAQGAMGRRCVELVAREKQLRLEHATDACYRAMGLTGAGQAELTSTGSWGLHFVGGGSQLVAIVPSLGSQLAGPASGGGGDCVVVTMGVINSIRALQGQPPIDPTKSPLLCTSTRTAG